MILASKVDGVNIHASVIRPIIGQSHDELQSQIFSGLNDLVESLQPVWSVVNGSRAIDP